MFVLFFVEFVVVFAIGMATLGKFHVSNKAANSAPSAPNAQRGRKCGNATAKTYHTPSGAVNNLFLDVLRQPHVLIAGCTGSGKSVVINGLISTILYRRPIDAANGAQLILIDPKRVELAAYRNIPHTLAHAAGFNPSAWQAALDKAVMIMDNRYSIMERQGVKEYTGGDLYVIIDEWANVYKNGGKAAYKSVLRLTSEGRAAKVHLIMATQVPKANIIPTEIRENFDARIALRTANAQQSRVIMDAKGCETFPSPKEAGMALGCYYKGGNSKVYRMPFTQKSELNRLVNWWEAQR